MSDTAPTDGDVLGLAAISYVADPETIALALGRPAGEVAQVLFPEVSTEDVAGTTRWVLTLAARRRVLAWERVDGRVRVTGEDAVRRWLALAGAGRDDTERLLRAWLAGELADLPQLVRKRPEELRRIANWLADCAWVRPAPREVLARLAVDDLRRRCEAVASGTFVGRKDVLGWMRDRLAHEPRMVVIEGGGGLGKSALLATYVLKAGAYQPGGPIVLWLDLDDPSYSLTRPELIHAELARQAAIQAPTLDSVARELRSFADQVSQDLHAGDGGGELAVVRDGRGDSLADYLFGSAAGLGRPCYLVVDTLERACHTGADLLDERLGFWRLQVARSPLLHLIVAGRGPLPLPALVDAPRWPLAPLPRDRAAKLLAELDVPDAEIHRVLDRLGWHATTPLNLRLCARAVAELGIDAVDDERLTRALRAARVAGYLQRRIIDHLPSPRLAEVVRLALHLPVITVADLEAIVGPLVAPPLADGEAAALFVELERVVDLVGRRDGGDVTLRPEVADELRELALDEDPAQVVKVLERALEVIDPGRAAERQMIEASLVVARRRGRVVTGDLIGPPDLNATAVAVDQALGAIRELLAAGRPVEAVDQAGFLVDDLGDVRLLIDLARAALAIHAWLRAEAFARRAATVATEPVGRSLAWSLQARAVASLPSDERPGGITESAELRRTARALLAVTPLEQGTALDWAEALVELAVDDRSWARDRLRALGATRQWTALSGAPLSLARAVGALAIDRAALDWVAAVGGFDGPSVRSPSLARVVMLVAARPALIAAVTDDGAERASADELATMLGAARGRGELGRVVRRLIAEVADGDPLVAALALVLDELGGNYVLYTEPGVIKLRGGEPTVTVTATDKARLLTELGDTLATHFDVGDWRTLLGELGDRRVLRRAASDDVGLAVRSSVAELDRVRGGAGLVAALERRGLHGPADLARIAVRADDAAREVDDESS